MLSWLLDSAYWRRTVGQSLYRFKIPKVQKPCFGFATGPLLNGIHIAQKLQNRNPYLQQ